MFEYKFETKKEILDVFKKIKKFIVSDIHNTERYVDFVGRSKLAKRIWCSFAMLFNIESISTVGEIIEDFYNIKLDSYFKVEEWEDKILNLYDICDGKYLEIE
jgi:hypothetical protein